MANWMKKLLIQETAPQSQSYTPEQLAELSRGNNITAQATVTDVEIDSSQLQSAEEIYAANGLNDLGKSIFKVEEIKAPLQATLPAETLKTAVIALIPTTGLNVTDLTVDGQNRIVVLESVKEGFQNETDTIVESSQNQIVDLQLQIESLKQQINDRLILNSEQSKIVDTEIAKVQSIVTFIS